LCLEQDEAKSLAGGAAAASRPCRKDEQVCVGKLAGEGDVLEPGPQRAPAVAAYKLPKVGRRLAAPADNDPDVISAEGRDRSQQLRQTLLPPVVQTECGYQMSFSPGFPQLG
jgi:hypothetical protein